MHVDSQNISHLFTVRLWFEPIDCESQAVRIRVQHVLSGEVRYFRAWVEAVEFIAKHSLQEEWQYPLSKVN